MKNNDSKKVKAIAELIGATCTLARKDGSKTWKTISEFKARKTLRTVLDRAATKAELGLVLKPAFANGGSKATVVRPAKRAVKPAKRTAPKAVRKTSAKPAPAAAKPVAKTEAEPAAVAA